MHPLSRCYIVANTQLPTPRFVLSLSLFLSLLAVAHKTHSSKSTNGFRYEMHETDSQTYCAAFLPYNNCSRGSLLQFPPPPHFNPLYSFYPQAAARQHVACLTDCWLPFGHCLPRALFFTLCTFRF